MNVSEYSRGSLSNMKSPPKKHGQAIIALLAKKKYNLYKPDARTQTYINVPVKPSTIQPPRQKMSLKKIAIFREFWAHSILVLFRFLDFHCTAPTPTALGQNSRVDFTILNKLGRERERERMRCRGKIRKGGPCLHPSSPHCPQGVTYTTKKSK